MTYMPIKAYNACKIQQINNFAQHKEHLNIEVQLQSPLLSVISYYQFSCQCMLAMVTLNGSHL